jgi:threonylcarbamoyladenosine tRNA methylthiotransferase MtaB
VPVRVVTLGCRLNQAESEETVRALHLAGVDAVEGLTTPAQAGASAQPGDDVVVVNTCTVTADAARSSRKLVRKAAQSGARVVVTGCHAVAAPDEVAALPGVVQVVANTDKDDLAAAVSVLPGVAARPRRRRIPLRPAGRDHEVPSGVEVRGSYVAPEVRGSQKVQTGCDVGCTFCIIPTTRGDLSSRRAEDVIAGIRAQVAAGVREVALTGVHLGKYGVDATPGADADLPTLVRRILDEVPDLGWLRLSSIEADRVDDALLAVMASDRRVCRHLHVPLQAGSDDVLAAMRRPYDTARFARSVERIRTALGDDCGVTTDMLVGFPGESDASFTRTERFVRDMGFSKLHVFRYSPRPGTPAAARDDHVTEDVKKDRAAALRAVGEETAAAFNRRFVDRDLPVMIEAAGPSGDDSAVPALTGTATNFVKVRTSGPARLVGSVRRVRVVAASARGVTAASVVVD